MITGSVIDNAQLTSMLTAMFNHVETAAPVTDAPAFPSELSAEIERFLSTLSLGGTRASGGLVDAMRYSLLAGGKRIRPVLVLATARAVQERWRQLLPLAAAIELIHTFTLIHDDLPAMDDDDLRRGQPTNHRVYGEDVAILAGDALFAEGVRLILQVDAPPERVLGAARVIADAIGAEGLVAGQYIDVMGTARDEDAVLEMHRLKTGALLEACVNAALEVTQPAPEVCTGLRAYAAELGVMFQIVDDILDVTATSAETGKSHGSDARNGRRTTMLGGDAEHARRLADERLERIAAALHGLPCDASELLAIAQYVRRRGG